MHGKGYLMKKLIVANWKMNGSIAFIDKYFDYFNRLNRPLPKDRDYVFCPPFPYLSQVVAKITALSNPAIYLGAQDCHPEPSGAFTGDVSAPMLKDLGCHYVIVGHSERRRLDADYSDSDDLVKRKAEAVLQAELTPIICVGETLWERETGHTIDRLISQITGSLPSLDFVRSSQSIVIAYEPIWAIGTGKVPTADQITEVHAALREHLSPQCRILYGGSVTKKNAQQLLDIPNVNGLLVGGASLKPEEFVQICGKDA